METERDVIVTDMQGEILQQFTSKKGSQAVTVNLSDFDSGIYLVKVASERKQYRVKRLVKQ